MRAYAISRFCPVGAFFGAIGLALTSPAVAGETIKGPVEAVIERVVDGDTLSVRAHIWLGQDVRVMVRLSGIDAPEMRGKCDEERALAVAATDYLKKFEGVQVVLSEISNGKFAGRVLAVVRHPQEGDLGAALLAAGLARAYDGGRRSDWCADLIAQVPSPVDG
ncbi:MAG: nuclease [Rhodobiaceae bacterium]|nr:MAG: nuclease [Rhodobiaceae bacterium]